MKKILFFLLMFMAFAKNAPAQEATLKSFYNKPERIILLTDENDKETGLLFIHELGDEVKMYFLLINQDVEADSKNEKKMVEFLVNTYYEEVDKCEVTIVKKFYSEADGQKFFSGLLLRKK